MPTEKLKQLIVKFPSIGFIQTYGQTECSPRVTALLSKHSLDKVGSVGKSIPNVEVIIVDDCGEQCEPYVSGEICVRGENIMKGYYKHPDLTKEVIINGWLHTGDIGYMDNEGFIYLNGRIKNIIVTGGINIYPEEVEEILLSYNGVQDVCVFGEEDEILGEIPVAKIVINRRIDCRELKKYCLERLSDYKVPVRFEVVDELSKTYNGKIIRGKR